MEKMNKKKLLVFVDVSIDGDVYERMVFELFTGVAPKTAENFRALCTGEKGISSKTGKPLHYKGTFFHRIIKGYVAQGGDFLRQDGDFGESIYDGKFPDESPKLKHDGPGLLSMAIADRDKRGSLFSITFKADHHLDKKCIVFGQLVDGHEVLKKIENAGDEDGKPAVTVKIINSGEVHDDKGNKLKSGKETAEVNNHELKRKGKHKKSSKKRRKKRRRHYSSESDSSTDTEVESSESDSDSDSDPSLLSDTSSSSDERRKKRKRSKKDRHRRGKGKDRRREKRHKRRDKKLKRRSKRGSLSGSESRSKSDGSSEDNDAADDGALDKNKNAVESREIATVDFKKSEAADIFEREEGEFPRENGEHQNNGAAVEMGSNRIADGRPDVVDDLPSKSRSGSLSPNRSMSKSMSVSPRRIAEESPGAGAKRSRSRTVSRSPQQIPSRSRSKSRLVRSESRSPIRNPPNRQKKRSISMSRSDRSHSHGSRHRSATVSPPRKRLTRSPPETYRRSSMRSPSYSPVRPRRSVSRSSGRPSRRNVSRSPIRSSRRSVSRSSDRVAPKRSPRPSPIRAPTRTNRHSYSRSPVSIGRRERSNGRSSSRSPSVEGSPRRIRRGRGFSDRFSYVRRYRSRSPDSSPVRSYRYRGRNDHDRYSRFRRSPRRYRSPPRGRTPPRYARSPNVSPSPIRYRNRRHSRSTNPQSRSPVERSRGSPLIERRKSPSRSRSRSQSRSSHDSRSPRHASKGKSRSPSSSPPRKGLVSYADADGTPDSDRD